MTTKQKEISTASMEPDGLASLIEQYGCGPVEFAGTDEALYQRHLLFDNVVKLTDAGPRERFEAFARSVRDVLSQRWLLTEDTYDRENPKRVYYLSMEFLIGRCLANNVTNLLLDAIARQAVKQKNLDWLGMLEAEPDAGLGNGGLGRLAACFLDSMATMQLPAMGYGLRYEYGIFRQTIQDGWQHEQPDNWLRRPDPWEVARPYEKVEVKLGCSFEVRGGVLRPILGQASTLFGIPFDRPVVGYGGKTINTLRLWAAAAPDYFDFQRFSAGDFSARTQRRSRPSRSRGYCIPMIPRAWGRDCASCRSISWWPARWPTWCGVSAATTPTGTRFPRKSPSSSTTPTRRWPSPN